ncbi:hypothetical protein SDC9_20310 [bioreactor metagenome]|uniref:Uncharacterized protein n=1 Tax=bioreactor metagenome TaxID=1076179 RepID=A0A644U6C5_9ZZZZ|nr:hypothetical protein [Methanocorpusculum sp.]
MPDFRVYVPESKSGIMYQFKEQFGKEGSSMIVTFMEESLTGKSAAPKNPEAETARIFDLYFGDIITEREFSRLLGGRKSAEAAVINRCAELSRKYPDISGDVIEKFKENHPNFAKIIGVTK